MLRTLPCASRSSPYVPGGRLGWPGPPAGPDSPGYLGARQRHGDRASRLAELLIDALQQERAQGGVGGDAGDQQAHGHEAEQGQEQSGAQAHGQSRGTRMRVADAAHRLDERRAQAVDLAPQVAHVGLDDVGVAAEVVVPHVVEDLVLGEHAAGVEHEVAQELELGGRELDVVAGAPHLVGVLVELEVGDDHAPHGRLRGLHAPQDGADARHELLDAERLGHVVVAAQGEAAHLVLGRVARREKEHREARAAVAQAARHFEAVDARHHDVEDDQVRGERLHGVERLAAAVRHLHREVLVAQRHGDEIGDALLVVDDQDAGRRLGCGDHVGTPRARPLALLLPANHRFVS